MSKIGELKEGFFAVIASEKCESNANIIEKVVMPILSPYIASSDDVAYLTNRILDVFASPSDYDVGEKCSDAVASFLIDYDKAQNTCSGEESVCSSTDE